MTDAPGLGIRRILVAMDGSAHSLAALDAAAELAGHLRSMLTGIFVEDLDLLHLAGLPFASELGEATATLRKLDAQAVERRLRSRARRIRAAFEHAASRAHVTAAFRVVRGRVAEEVLGASPEEPT